MCSGIPEGTYELRIGESFNTNKRSEVEFNTLRYDFKPASISQGSNAFMAISGTENVQIVVPGETKKGVIFRGSKKPLKGDKECLLVFDHGTNQLQLEKIFANINVKKTRDTELDSQVEKKIDLMRKVKLPGNGGRVDKDRSFSISSASVDEGGEDDDYEDDTNLLENLVAAKPKNEINGIKESPKKMQKENHLQTNRPSTANTYGILNEDLHLSESSDENC